MLTAGWIKTGSTVWSTVQNSSSYYYHLDVTWNLIKDTESAPR